MKIPDPRLRSLVEKNYKKKIMEDDPRWDPKTMGNKRGTKPIMEDDPRWNPATMGNKRWGKDYKGYRDSYLKRRG